MCTTKLTLRVNPQEEPYRFTALGKEVVSTPVMTADFLVSEGKVQLVSSDMYGNIRLYEYDPLRML